MVDIANFGPWAPLLSGELKKPYAQALFQTLAKAEAHGTVFPPADQRYRAFSLTPPDRVQVVILGQDPYHGPGQANGLAFSVGQGVSIPPSLRNIFTELVQDLGATPPPQGDLSGWARQGVLLLNTVLTVEAHKANSHRDYGWQAFTDQVIAAIGALPQPIAFVLWGAQAQKKAAQAAASPHPRLVLTAPHPSPLSSYRGFFGSHPFSKINNFLVENNREAIDFSL